MKIYALVADTFRELLLKATLLILAGISTLILLGALLSISAEHSAEGSTLLIFGTPVLPPTDSANFSTVVAQMQSSSSTGLFAGIVLFGIFATASVIPDALRKGTVDLYLSKPLARWELLFGKYLGAIAVIFVNILYFIGGMWLVFGIKAGVWNVNFLFSSLALTFAFASLCSLVLFLGVLFQSAAIPIIGSFLYLLVIGPALEQREFSLYLLSSSNVYRGIIDGIYYLLPQLHAVGTETSKLIVGQTVNWRPIVQAFLSSSLLFGAGAVVLYKRDF